MTKKIKYVVYHISISAYFHINSVSFAANDQMPMKIRNTCFVCGIELSNIEFEVNLVVNMKVCTKCTGSAREKEKEQELLDSLADGFVCGCI